MKAPAKLNARGKAAFARAAASVCGRPDADAMTDAVERYAWAVHAAARVRAEWLRAGEPLLSTNVNGAEYEHPLLKSIRETERHAASLGAALCLDVKTSSPKRKPGRPVGSVSAPDRVAEPPRLRAV